MLYRFDSKWHKSMVRHSSLEIKKCNTYCAGQNVANLFTVTGNVTTVRKLDSGT